MSWFWKGDANSPASFEKALSKLSSQITAANLALDTTRSRGRRVKALWTLYTTLTYLLYSLIIVLVLGPQNWSLYHYGGLVGSPLVIYAVRKAITAVSDWRISRQQSYLDHLQKQRESKIADLKKATKYDSTQELLQKYGAAPANKSPSRSSLSGPKKPAPAQKQLHGQQPQRTGIPPPPTANIPGRNVAVPSPVDPSRPMTPVSPVLDHSPTARHNVAQSPNDVVPDSPGFAPNAFSQPPLTRATYEQQAPHWYDRILDVLLGDDETAAKNRLALLCSNCRLVNGQAPPGVNTLEQLGRWRCAGCGSWNGVESEGAKVVKELTQSSKLDDSQGWEKVPKGGDIREESSPEVSESNLEGSTGREALDEASITKRVTRSAAESRPTNHWVDFYGTKAQL
ncbi:hypothetical protein LTR84_006880 [Exophiala bonariae]|uniref:Endoplasmic reticulum junction formation protein lunapark n=1 Tax=Exophiala bonariae TaxID=1690606 RepID=A0AAV9N2B8_9EURO|nr:hypothetical protein LTR84_006880 [Exophiala bonariae]